MHMHKNHQHRAPQRGLSIYEAARRLRDERDYLAEELNRARMNLVALAMDHACLERELMDLHGIEPVLH